MTSRRTSLTGRFKRSVRQPHYEIVTQLSVSECRERLTGRPTRAKGWVAFARPLKLDGRISDCHISVDLSNGKSLFGDIVEDGDQTRLLLWMTWPVPMLLTVLLALIPASVAAATILGYLPGSLSFTIFVSAIWGIVWFQRRRRHARYAPMTAEETVRAIANLIQASALTMPGVTADMAPKR